MCYYFDDIIKIEDFDFDNLLLDEKSYENIMIYNISYKTLISAKPLHIWLNKVDVFTRVYDRTRNLFLKNMMLFTIRIDILKVRKLVFCENQNLYLFLMLSYLLSQFLIKIKITTTLIYS